MSDTVPNVSEAIDQFVASLPDSTFAAMETGSPDPSQALSPPPAEGSAATATPRGDGTEPKSPDPAPAKTEPKKDEDERFSRGYARLAQREAQLAAKEKELEAKYAEAQKVSEATLLQKLRATPLKFLREMGLDNEMIAQFGRAALGATLEGAPPQYRELADKFKLEEQNVSVKEELEQFKKQLAEEKAEMQRQAAQEAYRRQYQADLTKHVSGPELSKEAPNVAALYAAKPESAMRRIYDVVSRDAEAKIRAGGHASPMSPAEAVKALEEELSEFVPIFRGGANPEPARVPSQPARPNLSNSAVNPAPSTRSTPDPETDWEGWKKAQEQAWLADLYRKGQ